VDKLNELLAGRLSDPDTGERLSVPVKAVAIEATLAGSEAELVKSLALEAPFAVVSDPNTHEALGARIERALGGTVIPVHLGDRPHPDEATTARIMSAGERAGSYIAVGSGTINDLVKYAAARQGKRCAVFATAPSMNGYTSVNAAITVNGHKKSLPAVAPEGVFIDLEVMAKAPKRLIQAGFGDAICRSTAQADWLMAHRLLGRPYSRAPHMLFADLEDEMIARAADLGDRDAIECLTKVLILSGFGMTIAGSSAPASQGEHLISHHLEMMPPKGWDVPFHGEQIAVTTLVMARLQEDVLARQAPPEFRATRVCESDLKAHFGAEIGAACWAEIASKVFNGQQADELTGKLAVMWPSLREELGTVMRPAGEITAALSAAGAPLKYGDLGLGRDAFADAVQYARTIRNRYTFLDLAADSGLLDVERVVG
jgi:glycerol-1-phosphate dehydrogenase [NAD(P)+]